MATHEPRRESAEVSAELEDACDRLCEIAARRGAPLSRAIVLHALEELRRHSEDQDWLAGLADYLHDANDRQSDSVRRGLDELARGELEPA